MLCTMDIFMEKNQMIKHLGLWIDLQENLGGAISPGPIVIFPSDFEHKKNQG